MALWAPRVKQNKDEQNFNLQEAIQLQQQQKDLFQLQQSTGLCQNPESTNEKPPELEPERTTGNKKFEKTQYVNPVISFDIGQSQDDVLETLLYLMHILEIILFIYSSAVKIFISPIIFCHLLITSLIYCICTQISYTYLIFITAVDDSFNIILLFIYSLQN